VMPLKYILRNCPLTVFEISNTNVDGTRRTEADSKDSKGKKKELSKKEGKSNAAKI